MTPSFGDLRAFLAVARHRNFRRAASELSVSPSALSHSIRGLERLMNVRLLNRTTRSVSPTEAGQRLLDGLGPALRDVDLALRSVQDLQAGASGTVRINAPHAAASILLQQVVPCVLSRFPEITVDLVAEDRLVDIVAEGFDAGIRLGEAVPQDMVGVPLGGPSRFIAVASPDYLEAAGAPQTPDDLHHHRCIRHRLPSGRMFRWEFEKHGQTMFVDVPGALTLNNIGLMIDAAADGLGLAYVLEAAAAPSLAQGRLVTVLDDWCPSFGGLMLYYPGHRQVPSALRAFIDTARQRMPASSRPR
jgi:DNA-binding transcriptional LysR family regulator